MAGVFLLECSFTATVSRAVFHVLLWSGCTKCLLSVPPAPGRAARIDNRVPEVVAEVLILLSLNYCESAATLAR